MGEKRDCPKCGTRMEWKTDLDREDEDDEFYEELYQCPKCHNIEVIAQSIGKGYDI